MNRALYPTSVTEFICSFHSVCNNIYKKSFFCHDITNSIAANLDQYICELLILLDKQAVDHEEIDPFPSLSLASTKFLNKSKRYAVTKASLQEKGELILPKI